MLQVYPEVVITFISIISWVGITTFTWWVPRTLAGEASTAEHLAYC